MKLVIRVALLDDHPAVLAGLQRLVEGAPDLQSVAAVHSADELRRALANAHADVAVLDYDLARGDGLTLCQRLKDHVRPPAVVVYSAYVGPGLAIAARIAGVDALVDKRAPVSELFETIRRVSAGGVEASDVTPQLCQDAMARLEDEDIAVAAMRLAGTSHQDIAQTLGVERRDVRRRVARIVSRLRPKAPDSTALDASNAPRSPPG